MLNINQFIKMKQIKTFKVSTDCGDMLERNANDWIIKNNINVIDIRSSYSFWDGYKYEVIYEQ